MQRNHSSCSCFWDIFGICGAIYEEVTRDPAKTALYERVDRERKEAEDRAIVNRVLFEQNLKKLQ